ncbi:MAG: hypothetical protein NWE95_08665 [Candidatus Bathyarchaeota archaeon]|nr:hypothetical protein [Candidatus Bathyarchaeota archaeon]
MQIGYIFLCTTYDITECTKSKRFSCSDRQVDTSKIKGNDIVFLFNDKTGTLVGPFTAGESENFEEGALYSGVQKDQLSENITVEWENLHELKNAPDKIPFLKDIKSCPLPALWTQELLTALKQAPPYTQTQE